MGETAKTNPWIMPRVQRRTMITPQQQQAAPKKEIVNWMPASLYGGGEGFVPIYSDGTTDLSKKRATDPSAAPKPETRSKEASQQSQELNKRLQQKPRAVTGKSYQTVAPMTVVGSTVDSNKVAGPSIAPKRPVAAEPRIQRTTDSFVDLYGDRRSVNVACVSGQKDSPALRHQMQAKGYRPIPLQRRDGSLVFISNQTGDQIRYGYIAQFQQGRTGLSR